MEQDRKSSSATSFIAIAVAVGALAGAFAYTAGWLTPQRLTAEKIVAVLAPPSGPALGHRRNHSKGICFTGTFEATGAGTEFSRAQLFTPGKYPVIGRLNLATADPNLPDAKAASGVSESESHRPAARNGAAP